MRILMASDIQYDNIAGGSWWDFQGLTSPQRMQLLVDSINNDHSKCPIDAVIFIGDLAQNNSDFLEEIKNNHLSKLRVPYYCVHGNHDVCPESKWNSIFGYNKNHSFTIKGYSFIVVDNWNDSNHTPDYGYSTIDMNWLQNEFAKYSASTGIFLISHYLDYSRDTTLLAFLDTVTNYKGLFFGHIHGTTQSLMHSKWNMMDGHWSVAEGGAWLNNLPWCYRILETNPNGIFTTMVFPEYQYPYGKQSRKLANPTWIEGNTGAISKVQLCSDEHGGFIDINGKVYKNNAWHDITGKQVYKTGAFHVL